MNQYYISFGLVLIVKAPLGVTMIDIQPIAKAPEKQGFKEQYLHPFSFSKILRKFYDNGLITVYMHYKTTEIIGNSTDKSITVKMPTSSDVLSMVDLVIKGLGV